jgi:hypothetical protein
LISPGGGRVVVVVEASPSLESLTQFLGGNESDTAREGEGHGSTDYSI